MSTQTAPAPPRVLLKDPLGSFGKVVGALAGAGIFLYLIGVGVLWQRLSTAKLQAQEVIAALPRDQLAVLGAREALLSASSGLIFGVFLYVAYRRYRHLEAALARGTCGWLGTQFVQHPATVITVPLTIWCLLVLPLNLPSLLFIALFLADVFLGVRSAHRTLLSSTESYATSLRPWLRLAVGLAIAVFLVSVARQREFPERFSVARIVTDSGARAGAAEEAVCGLYLGSTSDTIILGLPRTKSASTNAVADGECNSDTTMKQATATAEAPKATTLLVGRDKITQITLTSGSKPRAPERSLLRRIGVPLECISPLCQIGNRRISLLQPFAAE